MELSVAEQISLLNRLEKEKIDIVKLYILDEIIHDYEGKDIETIERMLKYTYDLWLHGETKASPDYIAYAVVEKWEEIKDNENDRDLQFDILCEVEEW